MSRLTIVGKIRQSVSLRSLVTVFALSSLSVAAHAQLPELDSPSTVTGDSTTARFFAGASSDNGSSFATTFPAAQPISVFTEVQVEPEHLNTVGNLYLLIMWEEQMFMRVESGAFEQWDQTLPSLQASFPAKTLQVSEPFTVLENFRFDSAGVTGTTLFFYLAYDTPAAPGQIYYTGAPFSLTIEEEIVEPPSATSLELYTANISSQIIQAQCTVCHTSAGVAQSSALRYLTSSETGFLSANYDMLVNYIRNVAGGSTSILAKPQGMESHTGGALLSPSSSDFQNLEAFVNAVLAE